MGLGDTDPCGDVGVGLMSRVVNRRLFVESLAEALELELKPLPPGHKLRTGRTRMAFRCSTSHNQEPPRAEPYF